MDFSTSTQSIASITYMKCSRVSNGSSPQITLAYALRLNELFRDWSFVVFDIDPYETSNPPVCTCVEGIAVQFKSPGFESGGIVALANAIGPSAPKTNVVRSSLEDTQESLDITKKVYALYAAHLWDEIQRLMDEEHYSLSWAMNQIPFLANPLDADSENVGFSELSVSHPEFLADTFTAVPLFLLEEQNAGRKPCSLVELKNKGEFWTTESFLTSSIEQLIREMPLAVTAQSLIKAIGGRGIELPDGDIVSNLSSSDMARSIVEQSFEVKYLEAHETDRRVDLLWRLKEDLGWYCDRDLLARLSRADYRLSRRLQEFFIEQRRRSTVSQMMIPRIVVSHKGLDNYGGVQALSRAYYRSDLPVIQFLLPILDSQELAMTTRAVLYLGMISDLSSDAAHGGGVAQKPDLLFKQAVAQGFQEYMDDFKAFEQAVAASQLRLFNPFAWKR
jgi:molecular chaperone HtpG